MFKHIGRDLPSSIVVFLVALPLCLGIALASGVDPIAGVIAGIIGGIIVAPISGSHVGVSGPAAGLAVIVLEGLNEIRTGLGDSVPQEDLDLQAFKIFLLAVFIGGIIQLVLGIARAGIVGKYFPGSVVQGMLAAIGILIFIKQIPHGLGYAGADGVTESKKVFKVLLDLGVNWKHKAPTAMTVTGVCLAI